MSEWKIAVFLYGFAVNIRFLGLITGTWLDTRQGSPKKGKSRVSQLVCAAGQKMLVSLWNKAAFTHTQSFCLVFELFFGLNNFGFQMG